MAEKFAFFNESKGSEYVVVCANDTKKSPKFQEDAKAAVAQATEDTPNNQNYTQFICILFWVTNSVDIYHLSFDLIWCEEAKLTDYWIKEGTPKRYRSNKSSFYLLLSLYLSAL